jgi:hypothetical protein
MHTFNTHADTHIKYTHTDTQIHTHIHAHKIHTHTCTHKIHTHTCTHKIHTHTCTRTIHTHRPHTHTHIHAYIYTHPAGFLWTSDQIVAEAATYTKHNKHKDLCEIRTRESSSHAASDLNLTPQGQRDLPTIIIRVTKSGRGNFEACSTHGKVREMHTTF